MSSPVSAPYCRAVLWGEADPEQFLPPLQRVLEVSVAWLVMPSKNLVEQLQRSAGHAAVVDACRRGCSDGTGSTGPMRGHPGTEPRVVTALAFDGHWP